MSADDQSPAGAPLPERPRDPQRRPRRHADVAWRNWGGEVVILTPSGHDPAAPPEQRDGAEHDLNEVGSRVWELCDGAHTEADIALALVEEFEVDLATASRDAADFIDELAHRQLVRFDDAPAGAGSQR
jgi:hypothetical protein